MKPGIRLRAVEPEDVDFMFECEREPDALKWSDLRAPLSRQQLLTYALTYEADPFKAGQLRLIIENKENREPVGILDLYEISQNDSRAFIGILISRKFRKKDYATAALEELMTFNKNILGLNQLNVKVAKVNTPALNLFKKAGFKLIAILPEWHRTGGELLDFILFGKKREN